MRTMILCLSLGVTLGTAGNATPSHADQPLPGLQSQVQLARDMNGIPHIFAENDHDVYFMQGWVHAQDRLFQMDTSRRQVAGTLSELFGPSALETDVTFRTLGLDRAAERSLDAHPEAFRGVLQAYSDGVNAFIQYAESANSLPPEYGVLQLTSVKPWTPLDSVMVGKGLGALTSLDPQADIDLSITLGTYQGTGDALGFDGTALFFEDLYRSAPFNPAATVPDAETGPAPTLAGSRAGGKSTHKHSKLSDSAMQHARAFKARMESLPKIKGVNQIGKHRGGGSNSWVVSGDNTNHGRPILSNDMHLELNSPVIFHQVHLVTPEQNVIGSSIAGAPCVVRGSNPDIAWGFTNARMDINDVYIEALVPNPASPGDLFSLYQGTPEPVDRRTESFSANIGGIVVPVLQRDVYTLPRRNNGPLITEPTPGPTPGVLIALSLQSTGFSPSRDPEGICGLNKADDLESFTASLQLIDFASQHITYADNEGNIGYFVTGEIPLREDLQYPGPGTTPPFLLRNGTGGNEWLPDPDPAADQATPYQVLPFDEMPQTINPESGIIINANNDPTGNSLDNNDLNDPRPGGGLYYLKWGGSNYSIRAGRITELVTQGATKPPGLKAKEMVRIQADTVMADAEYFTPAIVQAYRNAMARDAHPELAAFTSDPDVTEAVERFADWDFRSPTGIAEGYDADVGSSGKGNGKGKGKGNTQIDSSIATSIYSVWRDVVVQNTIDETLASVFLDPLVNVREERVTALKNLLDNFETSQGVGASGLDFFKGPPGADAETRRDIKLLQSLADALDLLASAEFAAAFDYSTNQDDYRWGRLHRIVLPHPLGGAIDAFNTPPAFGVFPPPLDDLAGIPVDGGFETIDVGIPSDFPTELDAESFAFQYGPTGRFVSQLKNRVKSESSLPGGESSVPGSPFYVNLLEGWLNNESYRLLTSKDDIEKSAYSMEAFTP